MTNKELKSKVMVKAWELRNTTVKFNTMSKAMKEAWRRVKFGQEMASIKNYGVYSVNELVVLAETEKAVKFQLDYVTYVGETTLVLKNGFCWFPKSQINKGELPLWLVEVKTEEAKAYTGYALQAEYGVINVNFSTVA